MNEYVDWSKEPDIEGLREAVTLMNTDPSNAEIRLLALVERGSTHSMINLGYLYWTGHPDWVGHPELGGVDLDKAEHWYRSAYNAGSKSSTFYLGRLYIKKQDYAKAREILGSDTGMQYPPSIFNLARMHQLGLGGEIRLDLARDLYERASGLGHIYAERALGGLLFSGNFGFMNIFRGLRLIFKSALECSSVGSKDPNDQRLVR